VTASPAVPIASTWMGRVVGGEWGRGASCQRSALWAPGMDGRVMSRAVGPGAASLAGLRWLASVVPAPLDAWSTAMGWAESTSFSHAARLVGAGLVSSCPTRLGGGSLYYATRAGVRDARILAVATKSPPAPSTWGHWSACEVMTLRDVEGWSGSEVCEVIGISDVNQ
jgi:hypothetical protein